MSIIRQEKKGARTKWDEAIADAKRKIKRLEYSISVFRKMKKSGEPWPTDG